MKAGAMFGSSFFGDTLAVEMGLGQPELAVASLALGGIVFGMKKMVTNTKARHEDRRTKKERDA